MRAILVTLVAVLVLYADPAPPGRMVDLGGRRLHLNCTGSGSPTVLVENGGGSFAVEWALVQPDGIEQIMDDLNLLLRTEKIDSPYILVGASLGCIYVRAYQRRYPEHVADGTHDEGITLIVNGKPVPISLLSPDRLAGAYDEYMKLAPKPKPGPADGEPLNRLTSDQQQARHWALVKLINEVGLLPNTLPVAESWRQEFTALRRQRMSTPHPLGSLPLRVLERSQDTDEGWHAKQVQLAALSSTGKLIRAEKSGHMIHLYRPDLVIEAITSVIAASKAQAK